MSQIDADDVLKAGLMGLLEEFGFKTQLIPSSGEKKSPDFLGMKEGQTFVFELKERVDDPDALLEERERLRKGEVVPSFESMGPNARVSEKAREGVKQLRAYSAEGEAFHLLWLHAAGRDPETQIEQFRSTLYGITQVFEIGSPLKRCYYFLESEFFRHRSELAGAVLTTASSVQICINTLSPHLQALRASSLIKTFHNALLDPEKSEREGLIYIADCTHNRRNKQNVLDYLQTKYGRTQLMDMQLGMATARIVVPGPGDGAK